MLLTWTNTLVSALNVSLFGLSSTNFSIWGALALRTLGACVIVAASLLPSRRTKRKWKAWVLITLSLATFLVMSEGVKLFGSDLPAAISHSVSSGQAGRPVIVGHPLLLGLQIAIMFLFAVASAGFTISANKNHDQFLMWLGAGAALASVARLNYFLFPSIYTDFVYTGDLLRLGFYLALLIGAFQEIRAYWRRIEEEAVERERLVLELERQALDDELTGLSNRRGFEKVATHALEVARREGLRPGLPFIDLNKMKAINDVFGHESGDRSLKDLAELIKLCFRTADVAARLGGDEFCVLLSNSSSVSVSVGRLVRSVAELNKTTEYEFSISVGAASFDPETHLSLADLMAEADRAMYDAKKASDVDSGVVTP